MEQKPWGDTYKSFSGIDMVATFEMPLPDGSVITKVVGSLATISYSIHNEKMPVYVLGNMNMKNIVFNRRWIAGTMVFIVFDRHWLESMMKEYLEKTDKTTHYLSDEIPPLNVTISFANEYGNSARMALYGVTFANEGMIMSVNDMYTENTFEFFAMDVEYITPVEKTKRLNKPSNDNVKTKDSEEARNANIVTDVPQQKKTEKNENSSDNEIFDKIMVRANEYSIDENTTEKDLQIQFGKKMEDIDTCAMRGLISDEERKIAEKATRDAYKEAIEKVLKKEP